MQYLRRMCVLRWPCEINSRDKAKYRGTIARE